MAIKDIFKMIKADRYTQDGREELIKAQEAITEDIRYKPGDISKATGLQKQPDGSWAPVKNAPAQKKSDKTTPEEMAQIKTLSAQYKNAKTDAEKDRIANEVKKIMGVEEKMKAEQSAPGWRAPGSESDPNTEGSIAWYAQQAKKSPSASGMSKHWVQNGENAEFVERTPEEEKKMWQGVASRQSDDKLMLAIKNREGRELKPVEKIKLEAAKEELAKRKGSASGSEKVTKMSDLVAQKSRPESAPTGRQPTPEMLEREKQRQSPEAKARRDKLDAEHPRTETGAPTEIKFEDAQKAINNGQVVQWKDSDGVWHDVDPKTSELVMARDIGAKLRVKTDENGNPVKAKPEPGMDETRSKLLELEKRRKKFEKYPDMDNSIKMQQAALLSKAGFGSRAEFEDFVKTMPTDSAPRILTGDCKVRIKKSK